jgi:3-oxoacyl-[acyl-carrier protein] reductase
MIGSRYAGLEGAAVLVTGAAQGLGAALAAAFADQGSRLLLTDVNETGLTGVAARLGLGPERLAVLPADLADVTVCEPLVRRAVDAFGRLDVLVNNAGISDRTALEGVTPDLFDRIMAVNLRAPFFLSKAALEAMRPQGRGRIVNVASMAARTGGAYPTVFCYAASKAGMVAMTKSFAKQGAADGILVNAVLPSNIDSPMLRGDFASEAVARVIEAVPLKRPADPREVAELILWLSSDACSYVTGASYDVNGGWFMV